GSWGPRASREGGGAGWRPGPPPSRAMPRRATTRAGRPSTPRANWPPAAGSPRSPNTRHGGRARRPAPRHPHQYPPAAATPKAARRPLMPLGKRLDALVDDPPDWLDGQARARVDGARHSLGTRIDTLAAWLSLLGRVGGPADPDFVDWLAVDRSDGREFDAG